MHSFIEFYNLPEISIDTSSLTSFFVSDDWKPKFGFGEGFYKAFFELKRLLESAYKSFSMIDGKSNLEHEMGVKMRLSNTLEVLTLNFLAVMRNISEMECGH